MFSGRYPAYPELTGTNSLIFDLVWEHSCVHEALAGLSCRSLEEQGPFNVIIHKLVPCDPFYEELELYVRLHPHTRVIDEVKRVRLLQTRYVSHMPWIAAWRWHFLLHEHV
jgi:Inositol 1,3,4-trisphosphate 5/6-kinase pre-ATP-grasp domain